MNFWVKKLSKVTKLCKVTKICEIATMDTNFVLRITCVGITVDTPLPREHVYRAFA
jgi:hypothetical protein